MSSTSEFYFRVEMTEKERDWLLGRCKDAPATVVTKGARSALELGERVDLPLERVDWSATDEAAAKGYSIVDQVWDGWRGWFRREDGKGTQ